MTRVTILHKTPVLVGHTLLLPGETHEVADGALRVAIARYGADAFRLPTPVQADEQREPNSDETPTGDDLTAIKGIGPSMQEALAAQDIRTFADLASVDVATLAAAIQGSEKQVAAWQREAQQRLEADAS